VNNKDKENITGYINDNVLMYVKEQMMENCGMENLSAHKNLD
jgi:hypothetical protein